MPSFPHDQARIDALHSLDILDTPLEPSFDRLTELVTEVLDVPTSLISLVDTDRQFFKSCTGVAEPWATTRETPLAFSFCRYVVASRETLVVHDARKHPLLRENPAIEALGVVAYLGVPLITDEGHVLGTLCAIDSQPREWSRRDIRILTLLTASVMTEITLHARTAADRRTLAARADLASERAEELEQRYRSVFEGAAEGFFLVDRDEAGEFRYVDLNPAMEQIGGFPREQIIGRRPRDVLPAEQAARVAALYEAVFRNGTPVDGEHTNVFPRGIVTTHTRFHPLKDETGRVVRILASVVDVTQRRRAEFAERRSEERYRLAARATQDAIWDWDMATGTVVWSEALESVFGHEPGGAGEQAEFWFNHVHPDEREAVRASVEAALAADGDPWIAYYRFRRGDGTYADVMGRGIVSRDPEGRPLRMIGALSDITARVEAARAVEAREEYYRALIEKTHDIITVVDARGTILYESPAAERVTGYAPAELVGRSAFDLIHPDDRPEVGAALARVLAESGGTTGLAYRFQCSDGRWVALESTAINLTDHPVVRGVVVNSRDVTERHRAAAELQVSETRYRGLFENVPVGIYRTTAGGQLQDVNPALVRILGYPDAASLRGIHARMLYADPADWASWRQILGAEGSARGVELQLVRGDGARIWARHSARAVTDPSGRIAGYEGSVEDITDRVLAEGELRASQRRLTEILEAVPVGIFVVDPDGRTIFANGAAVRLLGWSEVPASARMTEPATYPAHVAGEDRAYPADELPVTRALRGESVICDDMEIVRGGERVPLHVEAAPIRDVRGRVVAAVGAFTDISAQRRMEQQLRQASKMEAVGRLAGGVAHDFNNLLTAIKGTTELLLIDVADEGTREDLSEIRRASDRAADLTRQLLAFSRQQVLKPRPLRISDSVRETSRMLGRMLGEDIELVTVLSADTGLAMADPSQIEQVILNLAVNARDAMPYGGMLRISTHNLRVSEAHRERFRGLRAAGDYVCLDVDDTGIGMEPAILDHIFDPFFTTKEQGKGTGLGLATVHGIVEQSGGHVSVQSAPQQGTRFCILLPRIAEEEAAPPAEEPREHVAAGSETVLLVEDEDIVRRIARRVLARAGYTVLEAADVEEALGILRAHAGPLHLLLTDVVMPGMSGPELAAEVGELRPGTPVLYMSGYTGTIVSERGIEATEAFIQKPFGPDELTLAVRAALDRARA